MSVPISGSDTGAGTEAGAAPPATISSADTGHGTEGRQLVNPVDAVSELTMRLYLSLPHLYRDADATAGQPPSDLPLLRWLSCLVDQAGEVEILVDRFSGSTGGLIDSELTDPNKADPGWLAWLAQLVGVHLPPLTAVATARDSIENAVSGWQAGTSQAIINAVIPILSGGKTCLIFDHYAGNPWQIEVRTRNSETPGGSPDPVLVAIANANAKPAGFTLVHTMYEATWDTIAVHFPYWNTVHGITWDHLADTQP